MLILYNCVINDTSITYEINVSRFDTSVYPNIITFSSMCHDLIDVIQVGMVYIKFTYAMFGKI